MGNTGANASLGRTPPGDEGLQEGHSEEKAVPAVSTPVLGLTAQGSPVSCPRLLRAGDAGGQASTGLGEQPSRCPSSQPEPWLLACYRAGGGCAACSRGAPGEHERGCSAAKGSIAVRSWCSTTERQRVQWGGGYFYGEELGRGG